MFRLLTVEDIVRIPPKSFGHPIDKAAKEQIKLKYENVVDEELGYVILVVDVDVDPVGKILPGDGSTYHKVNFKLLTFYPEMHEIVEGEVVEVTDFGAFVRIGPEDCAFACLTDNGRLHFIRREARSTSGQRIAEEARQRRYGQRKNYRSEFSAWGNWWKDRHHHAPALPWKARLDRS